MTNSAATVELLRSHVGLILQISVTIYQSRHYVECLVRGITTPALHVDLSYH